MWWRRLLRGVSTIVRDDARYASSARTRRELPLIVRNTVLPVMDPAFNASDASASTFADGLTVLAPAAGDNLVALGPAVSPGVPVPEP